MARYHCLFIDHGSEVFATEVFECADDAAAQRRADSAYMLHIGKGIELWRDNQCIYLRDDKHSGPPPTGSRNNLPEP
jgi:hypothetical protein